MLKGYVIGVPSEASVFIEKAFAPAYPGFSILTDDFSGKKILQKKIAKDKSVVVIVVSSTVDESVLPDVKALESYMVWPGSLGELRKAIKKKFGLVVPEEVVGDSEAFEEASEAFEEASEAFEEASEAWDSEAFEEDGEAFGVSEAVWDSDAEVSEEASEAALEAVGEAVAATKAQKLSSEVALPSQDGLVHSDSIGDVVSDHSSSDNSSNVDGTVGHRDESGQQEEGQAGISTDLVHSGIDNSISGIGTHVSGQAGFGYAASVASSPGTVEAQAVSANLASQAKELHDLLEEAGMDVPDVQLQAVDTSSSQHRVLELETNLSRLEAVNSALKAKYNEEKESKAAVQASMASLEKDILEAKESEDYYRTLSEEQKRLLDGISAEVPQGSAKGYSERLEELNDIIAHLNNELASMAAVQQSSSTPVSSYAPTQYNDLPEYFDGLNGKVFNRLMFVYSVNGECSPYLYRHMKAFLESKVSSSTETVLIDLSIESFADYVFATKPVVDGYKWLRDGDINKYIRPTSVENLSLYALNTQGYVNENYLMETDWLSRLSELDKTGYIFVILCNDLNNAFARRMFYSTVESNIANIFSLGDFNGVRQTYNILRRLGVSSTKLSYIALEALQHPGIKAILDRIQAEGLVKNLETITRTVRGK